MTFARPLSADGADELLATIVGHLGPWPKNGAIRRRMRAAFDEDIECYKHDFLANFGIGGEEKAQPRLDRDRFLAIQKACLSAVKALSTAPQGCEWLQTPIPSATTHDANGKIVKGLKLNLSLSELVSALSAVGELAHTAAQRVPMKKARDVAEKDACALYAHRLFDEYSPSRPTSSPKGLFFVVASLMFELMTGRREQNLESSCRKMLKRPKPAQSG